MNDLDLMHLPRERLEELLRVTLGALGEIQSVVQKETLQCALIREQEQTITELSHRLGRYSRLLSDAAQWRESQEEVYRSALLQAAFLIENGRADEAASVIATTLNPDGVGDEPEPTPTPAPEPAEESNDEQAPS